MKDFGLKGVLLERGIDEFQSGAGGGELEPVRRQVWRNRYWRIESDFDFAKTGTNGGDVFGKAEASGIKVGEVRGEGFDFGEIVRGDERGGVSGGVDESLHKFFANDGVEAAKRFIEDDEFGSECECAGEGGFHAHAAREMSEFAVERKFELPDEAGFEVEVPGGIKRTKIF